MFIEKLHIRWPKTNNKNQFYGRTDLPSRVGRSVGRSGMSGLVELVKQVFFFFFFFFFRRLIFQISNVNNSNGNMEALERQIYSKIIMIRIR